VIDTPPGDARITAAALGAADRVRGASPADMSRL